MEFRVLGPLEVSQGDGAFALGGPKQRTVLAHLLLEANHVVTVERLIDALWGEEPPVSARNTLQTYIKHLRKLVGAARIEHLSSGYLLRIQPNELDVLRFEALVADARGRAAKDLSGASKGLREALGLWRGPALDDLSDQPSLRPEISRLEEMRIAAIEDRIEDDLALGRHLELIPELETLIGHHPYSERSWGNLMTALYRSGRQGDALAAYQRAREVLAEELGIDPSPELRKIQEQILRQDTALELGGEPLRGYRLLEQLGEGAFGVVHRAFQPAVGREVAVKVVHPRLVNDPEFIRCFDAEAQLIARLEHPHIVPVYDYWREPGGAYLVMRYLRGGNLRERLSGGPLEPDVAVRLIDDVAHALDAAHRQGIVHRDVQPANILFDEEGNTYLSDFGIARDLAAARTSGGGPAGDSAYYLSPEEGRGETPTQRADIYSLGLVLHGCVAARRAVTAPPNHRSFDGISETVAAIIVRATRDDPAERFPDVLLMAAATRDALAHRAPRRSGEDHVTPRNPYKGLRAFLEPDARDFFGREALIEVLVTRFTETVDGRRFLGVVGPSGSGKSSVVRAGLIPALRSGAIPGSDRWYFVTMMPGADPFEELEAGLLGIATDPPGDLVDLLEGEDGISDAIERVLPPDGSELFLVVDQLEELFTHVDDETTRARFLEGLAAAVADPRSRLRVLVTLRADHYDRPLVYPRFGPLLGARNETVVPLNPAELELAITRPAALVGVSLEPALLAEVVADSADRLAALPLLQYALMELFERRRDGILTVGEYDEVGGVGGALVGRAEHLYAARGREEGKEAIRQIFLRLVSIGDNADDLRRRVPRSELDSLEGDREAMQAAIDAFTRHRLLTSDRDRATREPTVEVAHEALLRSWPRLRGWIESARGDLRSRRELALEASAWTDSERDRSFLLRGSRLEQTTSWAGTSGVALNALERDYLDESLREDEVERAAQTAREERERSLERRSAKRLRTLVAVLGVAALVASGLTVVANRQRVNAAREARISSARELAAAAIANLDVDAERSILLAMESVDRTRSVDGSVLPEAVEALHRAVTASRMVRSVPGGEVVDWSPIGYVAMGPENDGTIAIRDPGTGEIVRSFRGPPNITDIAFSPDGSLLATTSANGDVTVWDVATERHIARISGQGPASGPSVDSDGSTVAAAWPESGVVKILDVSTRTVTRTLRDLPSARATALNPDATRIAVGSGNPDCSGGPWKVVGIDLGSGRRTALARSGPCGSKFLAWSPNGRYVVGATDCDSGAEVWDGVSGALRFRTFGHTDCVNDADWSSDSTRLATAGFDGTTRVWDFRPGFPRQLFSLSTGDRNSVSDVVFSPNDSQVMTTAAGVGRIWDVSVSGDAEIAALPAAAPGWWMGNVGFVDAGRRVVLPNANSRLAIWDVQTQRRVAEIGRPIPPWRTWARAPGFDVSQDGGTIAIAGSDGSLGLWDTVTGETLFDLHQLGFSSFDLSADGRYLAVWDGARVDVFDRSGHMVGDYESSGPQLNPDDRMIGLQFSPDDHLIAQASSDGMPVTIWDWARHDLVATIPDPDAVGVTFDPAGATLVTWGAQRLPRIWDATNGTLLLTLPTQPGDIYPVKFSPDGSQLAIGEADGTVRLFDTHTGQQLVALPGHSDGVMDLAFSPDGSTLVDTTHYGPARIWAVNIDDLLRIARQNLTRSWTEEECRTFLHLDACPGASA